MKPLSDKLSKSVKSSVLSERSPDLLLAPSQSKGEVSGDWRNKAKIAYEEEHKGEGRIRFPKHVNYHCD